jgi:ligand-binding sensor domain-containing protein
MEGERFTATTSKDGLLDDNVNAMAQDRDGGLWFGSYVAPRGGISVLRDGQWYRFALEDGLPHANVTCFLLAADGSMWAGTGFDNRGGAVHFDIPSKGGQPRISGTLSKADGLAGDKVRALYQDGRGGIWFASELDGLAAPNGSGFRILTHAQGLSDNETKVMVPAADGTLWLGTRDGITYIREHMTLGS